MDCSSSNSNDESIQEKGVSKRVARWEAVRKDKPLRMYHEFLAEMFGTCVLIMLGDGVVASMQMQQAELGRHPGGQVVDHFASNQYVNMGWGLAVAFGVMVSFETSGAHLNPAVTLTEVIFSGMSLKRALVYMLAQLTGALLGAVVVTINYVAFKGADALTNFYCTAPFPGVSNGNAFVQELICTALLLAGISAIGSGNPPVSKFHVAGFVGALVFAIGNCFGTQTGYAMNPARDLGPRLVFAMASSMYADASTQDLYDGVFGGGYWLIPIFAPLVGGPVGALLYRLHNHPQRRDEVVAPSDQAFAEKLESA